MANLRVNIGKYILNNKLKHFKRLRLSSNFGTARTVGILFKLTDSKSLEVIREFVSYLHTFDLQVFVLGYVDAKKISEEFVFQNDMNLFSRKQLSYWTQIPADPTAVEFVDRQFDILIDLSLSPAFPIEYIIRLSHAKFKIGQFTTKHNSLDIMFDVKSETSLETFISYVKDHQDWVK